MEQMSAAGMFRREGEYWSIRYDHASGSEVVRLRDMKGMHYLSLLLAQPEREHHVLELIAASEGSAAMLSEAGLPALDERAIAAYRARVRELVAEVDDAERCCDAGRGQRARQELDLLQAELAAACGLGGRARTHSTAERARKAVYNRIRGALAKIEKAHRSLGRHLRNSVSTGTFCSYAPERPTEWVTG